MNTWIKYPLFTDDGLSLLLIFCPSFILTWKKSIKSAAITSLSSRWYCRNDLLGLWTPQASATDQLWSHGASAWRWIWLSFFQKDLSSFICLIESHHCNSRFVCVCKYVPSRLDVDDFYANTCERVHHKNLLQESLYHLRLSTEQHWSCISLHRVLVSLIFLHVSVLRLTPYSVLMRHHHSKCKTGKHTEWCNMHWKALGPVVIFSCFRARE